MDKAKNSINLIIVSIIIVLSLTAINSYFTIKYLRALNKMRFPKGAVRFNATIGYEMSPSFSSIMLDRSYSIYSHRLGYRIPKFINNSSIEQGGILSVGCSFTYGEGVEAEQTFTYLVADKLHLPAYNYGVCSYSYTSVILQLNELKQRGILDELRPTILILGAGNWLVGRSLNPFFPTDNTFIRVYPYITKKDGKILILKPPNILHIKYPDILRYEDYSVNKKGNLVLAFKRFYFMFRIMPQVLYVNLIKRRYNNIETDINSFELYDFVICKIKKVIQPYGMKFIILWMPITEGDILDEGLKKVIEQNKDIILVDGFDAIRKYKIESGQYVNTHPRPNAHGAYAKEILSKLVKNGN